MKPIIEEKRITYVSIALIIILGFAVYGNSLNGKFLLDDYNLVRDNVYIRSFSHTPKILSRDIGAASGEEYNYYRPLQMFTYMIDYSLWKLDVRGYHLTNILLHISTVLALYRLIFMIFEDRILSLFMSLLFLVHPIHTEAVVFISARDNSLATLFILLCFISYTTLLHKQDLGSYLLTLLCYTLALLSKETSLMLPVLLLLYHYTFKKKIKVGAFVCIVSTACGYILLRLTLLRSSAFRVPGINEVFEKIPGFFAALTDYAANLALPFHLHLSLREKPFCWSNPKVLVGMAILISLLMYALRMRNRNRLIFFCVAWFFVGLLPASSIYPLGSYMAERWLYLPSIAFFLILAKGLCLACRAQKLKTPTTLFIVSLLFFYCCLTIKQNTYWREPVAFYKRTLRYSPGSYRLYDDLGVSYYDIGQDKEAIAAYKKAIEINPEYESVYNNLGNAYYNIGKKNEAIAAYKRALEINPRYGKTYYNLANIYYDIGRKEDAVALYKKAIEINPDYAKAYNSLGAVYGDMGNIEEAAASFKKAVGINPDLGEAYNNLATVYFHKKRYKLAIEYYDRAAELGFANPSLSEALRPYREQGR